MSVDLVVVNYKTYDLVQKFLDSLDRFRPSHNFRVILVDNEADLAQGNALRWGDGIKFSYLPQSENLGYAKACNLGASVSHNPFIAFLNSDTSFINDSCVDICVDFLEANPDVGVVGPKQISSDGRITHGGIVGSNISPQHRGWLEPDKPDAYVDIVDCVTVSGSAYFVRRDAWDAVAADPIFRKHWPDALGAMPEHRLYYEETAFSYAMPKFGFRVCYVGSAVMVHDWHGTIKRFGGDELFEVSRRAFRALMDDWGIERD